MSSEHKPHGSDDPHGHHPHQGPRGHGHGGAGGHGHGHDHNDHGHAHSIDKAHATHPGDAHAGHSHHGHGHHGHVHAPTSFGAAFALAIALNSIFVAAEFGFGFLAHSTALMADAGHNLSDVLGLMAAWGASTLSKRAPTGRFTYGLRGSSILAALGNASFLLLACGAIACEAVGRFAHPPAVDGATVMAVAGAGIAVNAFSAWLFSRGAQGDVNIRAAYMHMAADAAVSLGVVASAGLVMLTGWRWIDPAVSLAIVAIVVAGAWGLLRESLGLAMAAVPRAVDFEGVRSYLAALPGVSEVHDLHIWAISSSECALTAHLVVPAGHPGDLWLDEATRALAGTFGICHSAMQVETGAVAHAHCSLAKPKAPAACSA